MPWHCGSTSCEHHWSYVLFDEHKCNISGVIQHNTPRGVETKSQLVYVVNRVMGDLNAIRWGLVVVDRVLAVLFAVE